MVAEPFGSELHGVRVELVGGFCNLNIGLYLDFTDVGEELTSDLLVSFCGFAFLFN